jgi:hypothetical protein
MSVVLVDASGERPPSRPMRRGQPDVMSLPTLAASCAKALRAFGGSLHALDAVLQPLSQVDPSGEQAAETRAALAHVVGLLQREGPALLVRAQALRLRLHSAGLAAPDGLGAGLRILQSRIDALPRAIEGGGGAFLEARAAALDLAEAFDRLAAGLPAGSR